MASCRCGFFVMLLVHLLQNLAVQKEILDVLCQLVSINENQVSTGVLLDYLECQKIAMRYGDNVKYTILSE